MSMMSMLMMSNLARSNIVHPSNPELILDSLFQARDFLGMMIDLHNFYGGHNGDEKDKHNGDDDLAFDERFYIVLVRFHQ